MFITQSAIKMAPPFSLVSKFFLASSFYLAIFMVIFPFSAIDFDNALLSFSYAALVHVYLLGFVMMIIIGALYQLVPVVLEVSFFTLKFANTLFWILFIGIGVFCLGFFFTNITLLHIGGGIVFVAITYFCITYLLSFLQIQQWNFIRFILFCAGVCLIFGLSFGFITLLAMSVDIDIANIDIWLQRHILFVFGGFIFLIILGVSMVLLPMFSLSHNYNNIFAKLSFAFLVLTLIFSFIKDEFLYVTLFLSLNFYIIESIEILRKRARKQRDYWFLNICVGLVYLFSSTLFVFWDFKIALTLVMLGFLFHFIVGHLYKILPFLIWYKYISPQVGKKKIPMLHDMIDEKIAYLQLIFSTLGLLSVVLGMMLLYKYLTFFGGFLMLISAFFVLYNINFAYKFKNY